MYKNKKLSIDNNPNLPLACRKQKCAAFNDKSALPIDWLECDSCSWLHSKCTKFKCDSCYKKDIAAKNLEIEKSSLRIIVTFYFFLIIQS